MSSPSLLSSLQHLQVSFEEGSDGGFEDEILVQDTAVLSDIEDISQAKNEGTEEQLQQLQQQLQVNDALLDDISDTTSSLVELGVKNGVTRETRSNSAEGPPKPRTKLEEMIIAIKSGNDTFLGLTLKKKPVGIPLTQELANKSTFLHVACASLKMRSVRFVLERASSLINVQNGKGRTPLFVACERSFLHASNLLIMNGASPLILDYKKWTPLHKLAELGPPPPASTKKPDPTAPPKADIGYTNELLIEIASKILSVKSPIIGLKTNNGQTPLHLAIISQNYPLCKLFLDHSTPESLNIKDNKGNTPLHLAAYINRPKMLDIASSILEIVSEGFSGEMIQGFIDEVNNLMASALQVSMKVNNSQMNRLIIKYRSKAETKTIEEFFKNLQRTVTPADTTKMPLYQCMYTNPPFEKSVFGSQLKKIIVIIKHHYAINMYHQNSNVLLTRAKDTIRRFFDWLDRNVNDEEYKKLYKEILFSQTYDSIIHLYHETNKSKDLFFQQRAAMFFGVTHSELDISEHSWQQNVDCFPKALETFKNLPSKRTPAEKISNLNEATSQISRMDANDLTPMFMFLIIKSGVLNLQSEYQFMDDFKDTPEQEQYLVLLSGSFDYLETLNVTLRNSLNQIMSLSGIVDRTLDNAMSLCDEFQHISNQASEGANQVEDIDEGLNIQDELVLLLMMISKLANRNTDAMLFLPLKWSEPVMQAYHFKAIIERLGVRLDQTPSNLIHCEGSDSPIVLNGSLEEASLQLDKNKKYLKRGEICVILEHPYPQMVYQILEEKIRTDVLNPLITNKR
eukprot:gene15057-17818_t